MNQERKLEIAGSIFGVLGALGVLVVVIIQFRDMTLDFSAIATLFVVGCLIAIVILQSIGTILDYDFLKVLDKIVVNLSNRYEQDKKGQ